MGRGVDHGLGGKDTKRSQEKRAKRAMRQSAIAKAALQGGKKREIIFDENARVGACVPICNSLLLGTVPFSFNQLILFTDRILDRIS